MRIEGILIIGLSVVFLLVMNLVVCPIGAVFSWFGFPRLKNWAAVVLNKDEIEEDV